ncbi:MAG: DUF58 domain-containing protein [Anaerolineales bacterium]
MKSRLHLNVVLLPILVVILILVQLTYPAKPWAMLLVGLGGAWLVSSLWARALARNLSLTREMRYDWAQVGDRLEERFTVINNSFFPATWLEVDDHSNIPGYQPTRATNVGGDSMNQWITDGVCTRRGLYTLGGTTILTGDPLGIYTVSIHDPASKMLLVLPPVMALPPITVSPGGYGEAGRPRPRAPQKTVGAAGVREYQPGDSLRLIHWPSSAKHDKPFVRLFDGMPASDMWILLDLDRSVQIGEDWNSTEEHGVILAASLADRSLRTRQGVGLAINGKELTWIAPQENANQRWLIFHALALAQRGDLELGLLLERMGASFGRQTSLVIITASLRPNWPEALMPLTRRGIAPTVLLLDSKSFGGAQDSAATQAIFQNAGIACHVITQDLLNRPEAHPGHQGQWEWRAGRVAAHKPGNEDWRSLS